MTQNGKYCSSCGQTIDSRAEICPKCGVRQMYPPYHGYQPRYDSYGREISQKDWLTTLLLCFFLGLLGIHRFYTNSTAIGVVQLLTLGGCGIWTLVDFIMLLAGSYRDGENRIVKNV